MKLLGSRIRAGTLIHMAENRLLVYLGRLGQLIVRPATLSSELVNVAPEGRLCHLHGSLSLDSDWRRYWSLFVSGNHAAMVVLYFMYHDFGRMHQALRVTPAMEAGIANHVWSIEEIVGVLGLRAVNDIATTNRRATWRSLAIVLAVFVVPTGALAQTGNESQTVDADAVPEDVRLNAKQWSASVSSGLTITAEGDFVSFVYGGTIGLLWSNGWGIAADVSVLPQFNRLVPKLQKRDNTVDSYMVNLVRSTRSRNMQAFASGGVGLITLLGTPSTMVTRTPGWTPVGSGSTLALASRPTIRRTSAYELRRVTFVPRLGILSRSPRHTPLNSFAEQSYRTPLLG